MKTVLRILGWIIALSPVWGALLAYIILLGWKIGLIILGGVTLGTLLVILGTSLVCWAEDR